MQNLREMARHKEYEEIAKEYRKHLPTYEAFTIKVKGLVVELLNESGIKVHSVTERTKKMKDLKKKVRKADGKYTNLADVTDLSGVRVICLFQRQVNDVADIIQRNFDIIPELSANKLELMDPDRFGYLSIHFIAELSKDRTMLPEYKNYGGLRCEIQIRTLLQHAWAEIEHDLGYKSEIEVPRVIRRAFFRLAGLLELADNEFDRIIYDLEGYRASLSARVAESPEEVLIDRDSLLSYIRTSEIADSIVAKIAENVKYVEYVNEIEMRNWVIDRCIMRLHHFGIGDISHLDRELRNKAGLVARFATQWLKIQEREEGVEEMSYDATAAVFYLAYVLAASSEDIDQVKAYLRVSGITFQDPRDIDVAAKQLMETYTKVKKVKKET